MWSPSESEVGSGHETGTFGPAPRSPARNTEPMSPVNPMNPVNTDQRNADIELSTTQSWALLRECEVGRLAVVVDGGPDIFPVNYVVDHGSVVIRTAAGTKLAAACGHQVAFEVDGYDPEVAVAWSVVIKGEAQRVQGLYEMLDVIDLPLFPWHSAPKPIYVRVTPDGITGRRFEVAGRGTTTVPPTA